MKSLKLLSLFAFFSLFGLNAMEEGIEESKKDTTDYISKMPDEMILEIVLKLLTQDPNKNSKPFKDAINFLSTNKKFRTLYYELINADIKQIKDIKKDIAQLIKDWKKIKEFQNKNKANKEKPVEFLAIEWAFIDWIKFYAKTMEKSNLQKMFEKSIEQSLSSKGLDSYHKEMLKIVQILINNGADINGLISLQLADITTLFSPLSRDLFSPLYWALNRQDFLLAKLLLDNGALINQTVKNLMEKDSKIKKFIEDYLESKKSSDGKKEA